MLTSFDYEYASGETANSTTNLVSKLTQKYGNNELVNYEYTYDNNGNITEIKQNGTCAYKYTYDSLNQLKEEYDYINLFYINYSYDNGGNLIAKHEQALDSTYHYPTGRDHGNVYYYSDTDWKDKLTRINSYDITYDASGNPLNYRDDITFTWQNGRQLASLQTADNSVSYKYDSNGMRTQKTDNSGTTYYYYDSDKNLIGLTKDNATLLFYYDSDGNATSFKYNGTMYYYIKNLQGDIVKILDQSGTEVANYVYDAWGNIKSTTGNTTLKDLNPFRYRGYVYDEESSLYYLQSRYYDPFTGRFINADDTDYIGFTETVLSGNIFAYCENNPVNGNDYSGNWFHKLGKYLEYNKEYLKHNKESLKAFLKKYKDIKKRYNKNSKLIGSYKGYVYGQNYFNEKIKYGSKGTLKASGCGPIAIYNALCKINHKMKLHKIMMELEINGGLSENGKSGTYYDSIESFLLAHKNSNKIKYSKYNKFDEFKKNFSKGKCRVAIVFISTSKNSGHFFCIINDGNKKFYTLNRYNNDTKKEKVNWNDLKGKFISALSIE